MALLAVFVLAALAFVRVLDLRAQRSQILAAGDRRATNLSMVLSEYLRQTFASVDGSLRQLALHSERVGGPEAPGSSLLPALISAHAALTGVGSISVIDRDGVIRHSTMPLIVGQSRRDYFVVGRLRSDTADALIADTPFRVLTGARPYVIPLGRRLGARRGEYRGALVATFSPDSLRDVFRSVDVGSEGAIALYHLGGFVILREPSAANPIGAEASDDPLYLAARDAEWKGTHRGRARPDGRVLRTAFRALPDLALAIAISLSEDELLRDWRHDAAVTIVVFGMLAVAFVAILWLIYRQMDTRTAAEQALSRSQRLESVGKLTGGVAHDFNNLLTVILGNVALLKESTGAATKEMRDSVAQVERAALRGASLVQQLLAFARRQPLHPQIVNLGALAIEMKPMLERILGEDVQTNVTTGEGPLLANVDPVRAEGALLNLCINARDAMLDGGTIAIAVAGDAHRVVVRVSDTGSGIPPEHLPRVFEPFFTTKDVGRGTGLGLSTVYGFVKQSGGEIGVESSPGRGTTVTMLFPAVTGVVAAPPAPTTFVAVGRGEVILLVEDEPDLAALAERFLLDAGYRVVRASNGRSALEVARREGRLDLLLTDMVLPGGMSGMQLASQLMRERPYAKVLFMTGFFEDALQRDPTSSAHLIAKPFDRAELASAVHLALTAH